MRTIYAMLAEFVVKMAQSSILKLCHSIGLNTLNTKNSEGLTQLHVAIMNHDLMTAYFLIAECGADVNELHGANPNPFLLMTKCSELM